MKKFKKTLALLVALCMVFLLCSCSSSSKFVGNWVADNVHRGYPDQMILNSDGTGTVDGFACSWSEKDGKLTLSIGSAWMGSLKFNYKFSGSKLYLDSYGYTKK